MHFLGSCSSSQALAALDALGDVAGNAGDADITTLPTEDGIIGFGDSQYFGAQVARIVQKGNTAEARRRQHVRHRTASRPA